MYAHIRVSEGFFYLGNYMFKWTDRYIITSQYVHSRIRCRYYVTQYHSRSTICAYAVGIITSQCVRSTIRAYAVGIMVNKYKKYVKNHKK